MTKKRLFSVTIVALLVSLMIYSCKKKDEPIVYKNPEITWANPANITEGTLLSATQLNATADVAGIFVYTPAIGTKLDVGYYQDLKVDFTPTTVDYYFATKAVKINVIPSFKPTNGLTTAVFNNTKTYGTMTDQDGNVYKTITIGTQTWMAENLRTTKYRDGTVIPPISGYAGWYTDSLGVYYTYNNTPDAVSIATYGRLYNWYAVTDSRNIAPAGWHVPTDAEWTTLTTYLGGESVAGSKMKETGTTHWFTLNTGATNESGFTALPSGWCDDGDPPFVHMGFLGFYWTTTHYLNDHYEYYRQLDYSANVYSYFTSAAVGFAVRLVKD